MPLANKIRPDNLSFFFGQKHILSEGMPLYNMIVKGFSTNLIFFGPPGTGKTTLARILAKASGLPFYSLNATTTSSDDIRKIAHSSGPLDDCDRKVLLYLDEIQYLNKKVQQLLLESIEDGRLTLVASTTENPYFYVYPAVLSRCSIFEFKHLSPCDIKPAIKRAFSFFPKLKAENLEKTIDIIAHSCGGDVRMAINAAELAFDTANDNFITIEHTYSVCPKAIKYDKEGTNHFDLLSALQKSVRGSDENAALHYLARLLEAGDIISPCRRLLVMASEDIGLAYPAAVSIVKACCDNARELGLPEARVPLSEAVVFLCICPKSNSSYLAMDNAIKDVREGNYSDVPSHLKAHNFDSKKEEYLYPHDFPSHYVKQQYLPDSLLNKKYYEFGDNKFENAAKEYRMKIIENN